ncbi:MAG: beta-lactamase family protein [Butyrivibrio sp.]|nr:beta-lactamase family protein [Butyrivibrio sp.]
MAKAGLDVGELLLKLMARETGEISKVDYAPQKPEFRHEKVIGETSLERRTPESQGVSSAFFVDLIRRLSKDRECNMHRIMFLRHGFVVAECAFEPYDMDMWHVSYSMCKSIVGMAIGILVDEGKLSVDDRLSDIFSSRFNPLNFFRKTITVRQLLTMSSGVDFNEAGAISGNDWRKTFLESSFKFDPGKEFEYNSMNTYMLSAIVTELTGKSLFDFVRERIFEPMGIWRCFWESCPQSITKGGWGLFMRIEDMAKLGQLYLQKGEWDGKQIVPANWVIESTSWQIETGKEDNSHYGYQLWINDDRPGSFAYNGMMGQNVFIYPDIDMVVVTNAGNCDIFQTSKMAVMIRNAMKSVIDVHTEPLPDDFNALSELKALCKSVSGRTSVFPTIAGGGWKTRTVRMSTGRPRAMEISFHNKRAAFDYAVNSFNIRNENQLFHTWLNKLDGKTYNIVDKGVGIFPVMMQVVHNNFTDGINKIGFRRCDNDGFYIDIYEGIEVYSLRCGFGGKRFLTKINMHGEVYEVSLASQFKTDEYNRLILKNDIYFLEEACLRKLDICFMDDAADRSDRKGTFIYPSVPSKIEVRLLETPGTKLLLDTISTMAPEGLGGVPGLLAGKVMKGGMKGAFENAVKNIVQPVLSGELSEPEMPKLENTDNKPPMDEVI